MSTDNNDNMCANCGKGEEESVSLKACMAHKLVKYCIEIVKKPTVSCRKRAAELHDEALFKQRPSEDCPICFLTLPSLETGMRYKVCCGKLICIGCIHAVRLAKGKNICPFCRAIAPTFDEYIKLIKKRAEVGDAAAIHNLGWDYAEGIHGMTQDYDKALELCNGQESLAMLKHTTLWHFLFDWQRSCRKG